MKNQAKLLICVEFKLTLHIVDIDTDVTTILKVYNSTEIL